MKALRPLKTKIYLERAIRILLTALIISGFISFILAAVSLFTVIPFVRYRILVITGAGLLLSVFASLFFVPGAEKVIITADSLGLKERVITAWYLVDDNSEIAELQRQDTKKALDSMNIASAYKLKIDRRLYIIPACIITAAFLLTFIPGRVSGETKIRESLIREMNKTEKAIKEEIEKQTQKNPEISEEQLKQLKEALEKLKEEFRKSKSEEDALKALAQMENQLEKLKEQEPLKDLNILKDALSNLPFAKDMEEALKNMNEETLKEAFESLGKELENEENLSKLAEMLEQTAMNMGDGSLFSEALQNLASEAGSKNLSGEDLVRSIMELISQAEENAAGQEDFENAVADIDGILGEARKAISAVDQRIASSNTGKHGQSGRSSKSSGNSLGGGMAGNQSENQGSGRNENQGGNQGEAESGNGKGNQTGSGSSRTGAGGEMSGNGAGEGSTNADAGYSEGDRPGAGRTPGTGKEEEYKMIYVPERLGGSGNESTLPGQKLDSGSSTYTETAGPVQKGEMVPYREVLGIYREEAVQTMDRMEIPPGMKELVKSYFSSLE